MSSRIVAIVPAAGRGARMGGNTPKQFLSLGQIPLLVYSLRTLDSVASITEIIVAIPEADQDYCTQEVVKAYDLRKVTKVVAGGRRRQDSVRNGLLAIESKPELVLVHDGVRPFVSRSVVEEAIYCALDTGASLVAVPMKDTVKHVNKKGVVEATLNRDELWLAQTPQVFRYSWLLDAHQMAQEKDVDVTDDAGLVEQLGYSVSIVEGSSNNIKITRPEDLALGEAILSCQGREEE